MSEADTREHLRALVDALEGAFISTWQSTAAWQKELDAAREYLERFSGNTEGLGKVNKTDPDPCPLSSSLKSLEGKNEPEISSGVLTPGNSNGVLGTAKEQNG